MFKFIIYILVAYSLVSTNAFAQKGMTKQSKDAAGLYVFNDQIKEIFPTATVTYEEKTIKKSLEAITSSNSSYIVAVRNFYPRTEDLIAIKDFVREGNNVMLFATNFGPEVYDFFNFETDVVIYKDTKIFFTNKENTGTDTIQSKYLRGVENGFSKIDERATTVLGRNTNNTPNFIQLKFGSGSLFIHLYPDVLTNGFLLEPNKKNYQYTEALLSYLPHYTYKVVVKLAKPKTNNSYTSKDNDDELSFMSFVLEDKNLSASLWVGLAVFALVVLFGAKLLQRRIPVVDPIQNNTMEFAKTMGDLYFNYKNNNDIATKKIQYWQEYVRTKFQIPTSKMETDFWEKLTKKSGADTSLLKQLERQIIQVRSGGNVPDKLLIQLSNTIDQFYKS